MNSKGQTLLEVIIAIGIMVFGIFSIISLSITSTIMSRQSTKELIAVNLAREGIEVVRNIRDSNWLSIEVGDLTEDQWDYGLEGASYDYTATAMFNPTSQVGGEWTLSWVADNFTSPITDIYLDTDNIYRHKRPMETLEETPYQRLIYLNPICSDGSIITSSECAIVSGTTKVGMQVISEVRWSENDRDYSKILEEHIYDWKY